jgi:hypothetical protein
MPVRNSKSRLRLIVFNEEDSCAFLQALRTTYPSIRLVAEGFSGIAWPIPHGSTLPNNSFPVPYAQSLAEGPASTFTLWVELEGWKAIWRRSDWKSPLHDFVVIENQPRLQFRFRRSSVLPSNPNDYERGELFAMYEDGDAEHLRFLRRVWRIAESMSSNVHDVVDRKSGETRIRSTKTVCWSGLHVRAWCAERPERRIDSILRPPSDNSGVQDLASAGTPHGARL